MSNTPAWTDLIQALWPIFAVMAGWIAWTIWWAATAQSDISALKESAKNTANHSGEIMLIKQTLENLTEKVGELIDELRSPRNRPRK